MGRISSKMSPSDILAVKRGEFSVSKLPADGRWMAVVRIRGTVNVRKDIAWTLKLLRLHKPHHMVIVPFTPSYKGMLEKAGYTIAWGEINFDTFLKVLKKRGRVIGNKRLTDDIVKEYSGGRFKSIEELAKAIWNKEVTWKELEWLKPVFRLHPPRGGYRGSIKKSFAEGGSWGYWGPKINELIIRMI